MFRRAERAPIPKPRAPPKFTPSLTAIAAPLVHRRRAAMSSTLEDALAQLIVSDPVTFASLPLPLARLIFLALPADARGRASCVCRAWRDVLTEPSLWTCLEMPEVYNTEGELGDYTVPSRCSAPYACFAARLAARKAGSLSWTSRSTTSSGTTCCRC